MKNIQLIKIKKKNLIMLFVVIVKEDQIGQDVEMIGVLNVIKNYVNHGIQINYKL